MKELDKAPLTETDVLQEKIKELEAKVKNLEQHNCNLENDLTMYKRWYSDNEAKVKEMAKAFESINFVTASITEKYTKQ